MTNIWELRQQADAIINDLEDSLASLNRAKEKLQSSIGGLVLIGISGGTSEHIPTALRLTNFADTDFNATKEAVLQAKGEVIQYRDKL